VERRQGRNAESRKLHGDYMSIRATALWNYLSARTHLDKLTCKQIIYTLLWHGPLIEVMLRNGLDLDKVEEIRNEFELFVKMTKGNE
jgi:hypothetical protein